jgi:hypothetical protein
MVCDDVLAIDPNACIALPGYPQTKLWADTAAALGVSTTGCERVDPVREKFRVPLHPQRQFRAQPQSFTRLYELVDRDDAIEIRALTGVAALAAITRNTYRAFLLDLLERVPEHVRDAGALLRRARVFHVYRPRDLSRLPALVDALLEHFEDGHI